MTNQLETVSTSDSDIAATADTCIGLRIIAHPDMRRIGERAILFDLNDVATRRLNRLTPVFHGDDERAAAPLSTARVSRRELVLDRAASGAITLTFEGDPAAVEVEGEELGVPRVIPEDMVQAGFPIVLGKDVAVWVGPQEILANASIIPNLIGFSPSLRRVKRDILRVAAIGSPVLLRGETGVGKELVARAIHDHSARAAKPFVPVNMAAITPAMAGSQFFGHRRGAFTGANDSHRGFFADADTGTLFLDEIGDVAMEVQPQLLRAIEQGEIQTVGGKVTRVDVRLVAATESNLEHAVANQRFRTALLERFVHEIRIPSLRDRREDIGLLFSHFVKRALTEFGSLARLNPPNPEEPGWIPARFVSKLTRYDWPGNVRELRNVAERFALENQGVRRAETPGGFERAKGESSLPPAMPAEAGTGRSRAPTMPSDEQIREEMRAADYNISRAAEALGVSTSYLHPHIEKKGLLPRAKDLAKADVVRALEAAGGNPEPAARALQVSLHGLRLRMSALGLARRKDD